MQQHYVTIQPCENIFIALKRWRETAPAGYRGDICFRPPARHELSFPVDYQDEDFRDLNTVEVDVDRPRLAIQSVVDRLAEHLGTEIGSGIDDAPLMEALLRRRRVA